MGDVTQISKWVGTRMELNLTPIAQKPPQPAAGTPVEYLCYCEDGDMNFWHVLEWDGDNFALLGWEYTAQVVGWAELPAIKPTGAVGA